MVSGHLITPSPLATAHEVYPLLRDSIRFPPTAYLYFYLMETLSSTPYLRIHLHHTTHPTLELQWLDFVPSTDFRAALQEAMGLARVHQVRALLADNRLLRALRPADLEFGGELVFKGLSEMSGRRFAAVESLDAMNRMGVTALVASVIPNTKLASQFFTTIEEARAWATAPF
jgi:hypothetical protein